MKELHELTLKECACIIGITNNPSRYSPYIYPENNEKRTLTILEQMYLQRVEYSCCHNPNMFGFTAAKINKISE